MFLRSLLQSVSFNIYKRASGGFFIPGEIFLEFRWDRKSVKVKKWDKNG